MFIHQMKKFCIVQLGRIGDLILTTPLIKTIKDAFPESKIYILAGRNNYKFIEKYPLVEQVYVYRKKIIDTIKLLRKLRKENFDYWIDPKDHYSSESLFFKRIAKAKISAGFNRNNKEDFTYSVLSAEEQYNKHVIDRYLDTISFLEIKKKAKRPVLFLSENSEFNLKSFINKHLIDKYIHINISASKIDRYWPIDKWEMLIRSLDKNVIITADPKDKEIAIALSEASDKSYFYQTKSLDDLYSVSNHSDLLISPDTSVIHIASAFNKKIIGLYADRPWNLIKFAPSSDTFKVLVNQNSYSKIDGIEVEEIISAFQGLKNK